MQPQRSAEPAGELAAENTRLREELARANHERQRLEADLAQALEAARGARQELQEFVYAASHDLKEPLRSISSYTQLLQRHASEPEQMAEYSRFIIDGVNSASKLLEQLLRLSRAGSNPKRSMVKLGVPLQAALFRLQSLSRELHAEVVCGDLPEFSVDQSQFAQLLEHLVDNSLKYRSAAPPRIEISGEETDDGLLLAVRDNGVGIPPEFHQHVFAPFKRLHGREIPGAGLGLAISRKIVEAHDGKIWVESDGTGGSTVKIALPY
jgi:signal transduction histidine kinase